MPSYNFTCENCHKNEDLFMTIADFLKSKDKKKVCPICHTESMVRMLSIPKVKIERSKDQIIMEIEEDVRKTMDKINSGDEKTFIDVFGDKPNKLKNKEDLDY